jgi:imidazolonepropionase-like amidohydrolase
MDRVFAAAAAAARLAFAAIGFGLAPALAQVPTDQLAKPPANAETWFITSSAGKHGQSQRWTSADGARWSRESLGLRGFVTEIDQELRFAKNGALTSLIVRGTVPEGDAAETYSVANGKYTFKSPVDDGTGDVRPGLFYSTFGGTIDSSVALLDAMLKAPGRALDLLPSGRAHIEDLTTADVSNGKETKHLTAYAVVGFGFSPLPVWYDGKQAFGIANVLSYLPAGWESVAPALSKAQDAALGARAPALMAKIAPKQTAPIAFQNVRIYDSEARVFRDGMTVVVADGRISDVGSAASTPAPAGAQIISGAGKTVVPGLWDNHQHYGDDDSGALLLAQGITSVRDPGNRPDELMARKKRIEDGELLGPRIVPSLLIDGPGPYSAQVAIVVTTKDEAIAAVHRAKDSGYFAIKLYGSLNPDFVKPMATEAHKLGLRVHGHIPAGMRPLEAVRAGYDEITHINFVMMQMMPDDVVRKSNTLERAFGPGRYAANVNFNSPPVKSYLDELAKRHIAVDPTLVTLESLFVPDRGVMAPAYVPFTGTLPPQVERGVRAGGLQPPADLPRATMRASFAKLQALIPEMAKRHMPILAGTDGSGLELVRELELYVAAGLSPGDALASATITPARAYHLDQEIGSITIGKRAELVLVDGDPGKSIGDLRQVELVLQGGRVMKAEDLRGAVGISGPPHKAP